MATPLWLIAMAKENPALLGALLGAPVGAGTGALISDEGERGKGAIGGTALGGALGAVGGSIGSKGVQMAEAAHGILRPTPLKAAIVGSSMAGLMGGRYAKSELAPWIKARLAEESTEKANQKEAAMASAPVPAAFAHEAKESPKKEKKEQHEAGETPAVEKIEEAKLAAFEFGMEAWLKEQGVEKPAFAQAIKQAGLLDVEGPEQLAEKSRTWLQKVAERAETAEAGQKAPAQ